MVRTAAAAAGRCEMHCGTASRPSSTQDTSGAYLMEQAEQVHIWALGAYLAVLGTVAEGRSREQLLRVDGSPVLSLRVQPALGAIIRYN